MSALEPGSIEEVIARLFVWGTRAPKGLARAEFTSEFSRQRVVSELRSRLLAESIPFHEIELPIRRPAMEIVRFLVAQFKEIDRGVVSISGFTTAFPDDVSLQNSLRILNSNRENLANFPLCQIWWMTPSMADAFIHAIPDLNSWFIVKLHLTENIAAPLESRSLENTSVSSARQEEARRNAADLVSRFDNGIAAEADIGDLIRLARIAVNRLSDGGLLKEAEDSSRQLLDSIIHYAHLEGKLHDERDNAQDIADVWLEYLGDESADTTSKLVNLVVLYNTLRLFGETEALWQMILRREETELGSDHPDRAVSLNNLAYLYQYQGRYSEAEPLYLEALKIWRKQLGSDHPDTANSLNNLAELYRSQGRYSEAEPLFLESLEVRRKRLGSDHLDTATSLNNLAHLYASQGRYSEAEPLFLESLEIRRKRLGSDHPSTATSLNNLAHLYASQCRYLEAETLYLEALAIDERVLTPDHPDLAIDLENYADLLAATNRQAEAEQMRARAKAIRQKHTEKNQKAESLQTQES